MWFYWVALLQPGGIIELDSWTGFLPEVDLRELERSHQPGRFVPAVQLEAQPAQDVLRLGHV